MAISHQKLKLEQVRQMRADYDRILALQAELGLKRLSIGELARKNKVDKRTAWLCVHYKTYTEIY